MHQDKAELYVRIVPFTNADHKRISRNKNNPLQRIKVSNNTTLYTISSYIHGQASGPDQKLLSVSLHVPFSNKCVQLPLSMSVADFLLITNQVKQGELRYRFDRTDEQNQQQYQFLQQSTGQMMQQQNQFYQSNPNAPNQIPYDMNSNRSSRSNNLQYQKTNILNSNFNNEQNYHIHSLNPPSGTYTYDTNVNINPVLNTANVDNANKINFATNSTNSNDNSIRQQDSPPTYPLPDFLQPPINTDSNNLNIFHSGFHLFSNSFSSSFPTMIDSLNYSQNPYEASQNTPSKESISLKNDLENILRK